MKSFKVQDLNSQNSLLKASWLLVSAVILGGIGLAKQAIAEVPLRPASEQNYAVTVNSDQDGVITPDAALTLREAIALTSADLSLADLSEAERHQIKIQPAGVHSRITFALPPASTIHLKTILPPLRQAGLTLDARSSDTSSEAPLLTLTPETNVSLPIGLLAIADNITIQGLQFLGFHSDKSTDYPFVGGVVVTTGQMLYDLGRLVDIIQLTPPQNVLIEGNQFGALPTAKAGSESTSAFGVVLFDAIQATVQQNKFFNLRSSGLLTGKTATGLTLKDNLFVGNGGNGMGDAVRLEGAIANSTLVDNSFCQNNGAGIFLFKPEGAIAVTDNLFYDNGLRHSVTAPIASEPVTAQISQVSMHPDGGVAAIYLTGSGHKVNNNRIMRQGGAGVVVAAYPNSDGNQIQGNTFAELQGLSIDLVTREATDIHAYESGDGINPWRNSPKRRIDTGNSAVNAPHFAGLEFFPFGDRLLISGIADPNVTVDLYRVLESGSNFGPLSELWTQTKTDAEGKFSLYLENWKLGDRLSAIATDPVHGTSEPAENAIIRSFNSAEMPLPEQNFSSLPPPICQ